MHKLLMTTMLLLGLVWACNPDPDPQELSAPEIFNFVFQPQSVPTMQQADVVCSVDFKDADADVTVFWWRYKSPDGSLSDPDALTRNAVFGKKEGSFDFTVHFNVGVAGTYTLEIWAEDESERESNHLYADVLAIE